MAGYVEKTVEKLAEELLADTGLELVDVEYVKEKDWYLRVYIDKPEGIDIEDCQALSEKLEKELDEKNVVPDSYILEVSSPGLDRVLKKEKDFVREAGKMVDVSLYEPLDGSKQITGKLIGCEDNALKLEELEPIDMKKIAQVRLHIDI
ncbi:MAG: ribosome maturation factor RimP [Schwartzia sp.]|uniref:ribosome maturation factor RimP n=1 Tax=Schwartzia succinivorans TaxID=55507 RepID=UPI002357A96A|nr:ribosome maturation factor RimP [Schwartzia succinivorans]MBQ1470523.1 ribosome maturation factor RimP [Schwartzia sp. (in: firmicutes)]MBE6098115.1 ribosome maturation factor RimP [Schwartzia succinivorans]MBQ1918139.1 ribosome maturation factor RimP [Schwartzia sp. (in: firmicutes)]MBQ3863732.1 ribosome maturation factor RimP [Schwartzia sp. (in: firmicutes)]MBQ5413554.1 ribosome maturation factor RimP [Schwartzia sp. (in: firmicutes)]